MNITIKVSIPPFYNAKTTFIFKCIDQLFDMSFCNINYAPAISFGRNVNGSKDYIDASSFLLETSANNGYYKDTATLDLGILTNTSNIIKVLKFFKKFFKNSFYLKSVWSKTGRLQPID
jgi:hypothetical protein